MSDLSEAKRAAIAALIEAAPDAMLTSIEAAFRTASSAPAVAVRNLAVAAQVERAARALAFEPILPLFKARADGVKAPCFPAATLSALWRELAQRRPDAVAILAARIRSQEPDAPGVVVDGLCAEAAALLREGDVAAWCLASEADAESLAAYFELTPLARATLPRLHEWLGRIDHERGVSLRLAFKDAAGVRDDGAARLLELMLGHLDHAGQVLRLVAAITDGARESFIRNSELADFGERLVAFVEERAGEIRRLGPRSTAAETEAAMAGLSAAVEILSEFDINVPPTPEGDWSRRLASARSAIGGQLETIVRGVEKLVDKALPLASTRIAGRMSRLAPNLAADPESAAVHEARRALTMLHRLRGAASALGCESLRAQVAESVAVRVDSYAEEVLQLLHGGDAEDPKRALALLEVAAEFLGLSRDESAAALVRRRAAVALAADAGPDGDSQAA